MVETTRLKVLIAWQGVGDNYECATCGHRFAVGAELVPPAECPSCHRRVVVTNITDAQRRAFVDSVHREEFELEVFRHEHDDIETSEQDE
jgi:DNA-directed RNA polymerase subunit RPC12/RpoP